MRLVMALGLASLVVGCYGTTPSPGDLGGDGGSNNNPPANDDAGSTPPSSVDSGSLPPPNSKPDASTQPPTQHDAGSSTHDASTPPPVLDSGSTPDDAASPLCTPDTYANYAQAFFTSSCDNCHGHAFGTSYSNYSSESSSISSKISSGSMPQGATLSATDKTRILKWISCGGPQ